MEEQKEKLNVIDIIEKNPIKRLRGNYNDKLLNKLNNVFNENDQKIFLASFYCYLNYNTTKDFVIDLDTVWKWIGFARKDNCKKVIVKHFTKNDDYKIVENDSQTSEDITLTINCFKKLCLKANTKKADDIHEYYIKLEEVIHEVIDEESEELRFQLTQNKLLIEDNKIKEELLKCKDKAIDDLIDYQENGYIYIAQINNLHDHTKIGVSKTPINRNDQHSTSSPNFLYMFVHKSKYYKFIESTFKAICKGLLKNMSKSNTEWYNLNFEETKKIMNFVISMWDNFSIYEKDGIMNFVNRFEKKKSLVITNDCIFYKDIYKEFITDNVVYKESSITPLSLLKDEFNKWKIQKGFDINIVSQNNCFSTKFTAEFVKSIEYFTNTHKENINLIDKTRNFNFNKVTGFIGFELKSMKAKNNIYFSPESYKFVLSNILKYDSKYSITTKEIISLFLQNCKLNNINSKLSLYRKETSTDVLISFKAELRYYIMELFNTEYKISIRSKNYKCIPGYTNLTNNL